MENIPEVARRYSLAEIERLYEDGWEPTKYFFDDFDGEYPIMRRYRTGEEFSWELYQYWDDNGGRLLCLTAVDSLGRRQNPK